MSRDLTLLTDLYQLTMMQGYYNSNSANNLAVFDMFYRKNPSNNGFAIVAGLEQVIEYIQNLKFSDDDIAYLNSLNIFTEGFIEYLKDFKFTGDIYAIPEGTVVFPNEPLLRVHAPMIQAQFIETAILNIINHQSLIATKASRVCWSSKGNSVLEFGLRRAQGPDAGVYGARAAVIGGCSSTSNVLAGKMFNIPISGTHSHSWVMSFDSELEAFRVYAKNFPNKCILLVDTYDTLKSGVPNAIKVFKELNKQGISPKLYGIRLDSGDLAYLSKEARKMLDEAGFESAVISASNDLDEYIIQDLKMQDAKIDIWGVGTSLITSKDCSAFGGVYKLVAEVIDGKEQPKIKLSDNIEKITNPSIKKIYRIYTNGTDKIKADLVALENETINLNKELELVSEKEPWKKMILQPGTYYVKELLVPIFKNGKLIYKSPSVMEIQEYCKKELSTLWEEYRRLINPHVMPVDLSDKLYDLKKTLIYQIKKNNE